MYQRTYMWRQIKQIFVTLKNSQTDGDLNSILVHESQLTLHC